MQKTTMKSGKEKLPDMKQISFVTCTCMQKLSLGGYKAQNNSIYFGNEVFKKKHSSQFPLISHCHSNNLS